MNTSPERDIASFETIVDARARAAECEVVVVTGTKVAPPDAVRDGGPV